MDMCLTVDKERARQQCMQERGNERTSVWGFAKSPLKALILTQNTEPQTHDFADPQTATTNLAPGGLAAKNTNPKNQISRAHSSPPYFSFTVQANTTVVTPRCTRT
jgi:hypothetical protein